MHDAMLALGCNVICNCSVARVLLTDVAQPLTGGVPSSGPPFTDLVLRCHQYLLYLYG